MNASKYREYWTPVLQEVQGEVKGLEEGTIKVVPIKGLTALGKRNNWNANGSTIGTEIVVDPMAHGRALQLLLLENEIAVKYSISGDGTKLSLKK